jgi:predicted ester cyclase
VTAEDGKAVIQAFYDQWNAGEIDFERLVSPEVTNHQPGREPEAGVDAFRRAIEGVMAVVPDSHWTTARLIAEGEYVVCHNIWSGTYGGSWFRNVPTPSDQAFTVEHVHIYRVVEGRIAEHWVVRDDLALLQQIGAVPTSG